ncbi:hypothetical protein DFP72DRAFT_847220 [Ephemerocybe angulata]|uniref:Uncharacterized protein n=1 Tax=Ephemerocybe angulata TaxID=980116 RepID=A0A8H6I0T9_9AGAR|nr:hypothetical protein DFP72DRAFT_847220 [Tulosesus angulatus]
MAPNFIDILGHGLRAQYTYAYSTAMIRPWRAWQAITDPLRLCAGMKGSITTECLPDPRPCDHFWPGPVMLAIETTCLYLLVFFIPHARNGIQTALGYWYYVPDGARVGARGSPPLDTVINYWICMAAWYLDRLDSEFLRASHGDLSGSIIRHSPEFGII